MLARARSTVRCPIARATNCFKLAYRKMWKGPVPASSRQKRRRCWSAQARTTSKCSGCASLTFANGDAVGPLALARPREGTAELYAIGSYRGRAETSRFSIERFGPRILVTAGDDACTTAKPGQACQSKLSVFLMNAGRLSPVADLTLDRIEYGSAAGVAGTGSVPYDGDAALRAEGVARHRAGGRP